MSEYDDDFLPEGWAVVPLSSLVSGTIGGDWGSPVDEANGDSLIACRVIRGTEFRNWDSEKGAIAARRAISSRKLESRQLRQGDLVLEVSGGGPQQPVGRTILIDVETSREAEEPIICSNFCRRLQIVNEISSAFVWWNLRWQHMSGKFDQFQTQTTNLRNLNVTEFLHGVRLPLPPLAEQRRIVAKVEELLARVRTARLRLARIPTLLKRFRQSILTAACNGNLTADWREEHSVDDVEKLIRTNDFKLADVDNHFDALPSSWRLISLGNIAHCSRGRFLVRPRNDPAYFDGPYPFIQIGSLPPEGGWVSSHVQTLNEKGLKVSKMFPRGTIAIAIVGATIGNTGLLS